VTDPSQNDGNTSPSPPRFPRASSRESLEAFNWSGGWRTVFDTLATPASFVFVAFALSVGVARERIGLLVALASFACLAQVLALPLLNHVPNKKRFILTMGSVEPVLLMMAVLVLPWLPAAGRIGALAVAVFIGAIALHTTRPLTESWIATTVPIAIRGRFLGRRTEAITAFAVVATLGAGWIAEWIDQTNTFGLSCLLATGGVFGLLAVVALRRASMPAVSAMAKVTAADWRVVLQDRGFRRYLLGVLIYNVPFFLAIPYYQVFHLTVLHLQPSVIAYMTVGFLGVKVITARFLGRHVDRTGHPWMLLMTGPIWVLFFAGFALSTPDRVWPVFISWTIAGIAEAAYIVAATGALYAATPHSSARPAYFAVSEVVVWASLALGALVAVPLLEWLKGFSLTVGPVRLGQFQCFFALWTLAMIPSMFAARLFSPKPPSTSSSR